MKKILFIFIVIASLILISFLVFGRPIETIFSQEKLGSIFTEMRSFAWLIAILLLIADVLLPIPATGVMAALGQVYGFWTGVAVSCAGSFLSGLFAYGLARYCNNKISRWIISPKEEARFNALFHDYGGYAVIISRVLPVMAETIVILAGFSKMDLRRFLSSLFAGAISVSFLFVSIGVYSKNFPVAGILLAILLPAIIWPVFVRMARI